MSFQDVTSILSLGFYQINFPQKSTNSGLTLCFLAESKYALERHSSEDTVKRGFSFEHTVSVDVAFVFPGQSSDQTHP